MSEAKHRVVYFNRWMHADGLAAMAAAPEIELTGLDWHAPEVDNWPVLTRAHGYQISSARHEMPAVWRADAALLARCPDLLAISAGGAGYDTVDVEACTTAGVIVVNQAGANKEAVAEHALGMMLMLSKRIMEMDRALRRDREWHRNDFIGNDMRGKTLAIVGLGHIGTRLAELCGGLMDMTVVASDPYLSESQFAERGARRATFEKALGAADYVSVHCSLTGETRGMIGARAFALMKPGVTFVNTARGGIHDENALAAALRSGHVRGAGIDVWDEEPPPLDHPLLGFDNVVLSCHTGGVTEESRRRAGLAAAEQWRAIWRGERPARLLNPEAWPAYAQRFTKILGRPTAS